MTWQGVGARGGGTGVAQRGAGGTRRARVSSQERDKRSTQRKKKKNKTPKQDKQRGQGRAGGGVSRGPTKAQRYTSFRSEKRHADDPH